MIDFEALYDAHAAEVFRFALYLSGDRHAAEDVVSETFVRVWGARDRLELRTVRGYLLAIARNVYLHELRHRTRAAPLDPSLPDPRPRADRVREASDELERVLAELRELPEVDRAALVLRVDEELPFEEIAAILGITPVSARVKVHRARVRLAAGRRERDEGTRREGER